MSRSPAQKAQIEVLRLRYASLRMTSRTQLIGHTIHGSALNVGRWTLDVGRSARRMTSYTHPLSTDQAAKLRVLLQELGFEFAARPYTLYFAQKNKLSV